MSEITATAARDNLAELIGRAAYGKERITIERRGRPVAALVPIEDLDALDGGAQEALRQSEAALRTSEARLRDLVEGSLAGILIHRENRPLMVNKTWAAIHGYTVEEVLAMDSIMPLISPDDWDMMIEYRDARLRGEAAPAQYEYQALRKNETRMRLLTDAVPALISYLDADQRYRFNNRLYEEWMKRPRAEILGKRADEVFSEAAYQRFRPYLERALAGERVEYESTITFPDARQRHYAAVYVPDIDPDGRVRGVSTMVQDITERKRAEEALRENEERLRQATQLAGLGYWVWDAIKDRCIYCSEEHARSHGLSPDEYIARSSALDGEFSLTHPDDRAEVNAAYTKLRAGTAFEMEYKVTTPDGTVRHIRESAKPVFDQNGAVIREYGTSQDVTEQRAAEERLRHAQKMEAVGQLTGGVAHDFNNLLAVIMGNAELLGDRVGQDNRQVSAVLRAATRGAELTHRLLAFSRRQALVPHPIALDAVVRGLSGMLGRTLGETIEIEVSAQPDLWPALADQNQLENALLNLAINARDAMRSGGTLTIESENVTLQAADTVAHADLRPGDYVLLAVRDIGCGIAPENLEHVFEPFFTTKEVGQGSGLGLSMVYGFAQQSGGHVAIDSAPGEGTTVRLYLPRAEQDAAPATPPVADKAPGARGETVLVLEDDDAVSALAVAILENLGYRVITAAEGRAALSALERTPRVDVVLSDVVLAGGMSGPEFVAEAVRRRPDLKVLFMSGYAADDLIHEGKLDDGVTLINKPFRTAELASMLREILDAA